MEKFNNSSLFTGYLKQLLHNFNLPTFKVYTKEDAEYKNKNGVESPNIVALDLTKSSTTDFVDSTKINNKTFDYDTEDLNCVTYIKNGKLQRYIKYVDENGRVKKNWFSAGIYYFDNKKYLNETKNLVIKNNRYDSYTHEYLGEYLRFKRDYFGVDLMTMYNCFSNRLCDKLSINKNSFAFDTKDITHKIYMIPVKMFKEYTIAIDCDSPIELCCGIYGKYQDKREKFESLPTLTYQRVVGSRFNSPFVYNKLKQDDMSVFSERLLSSIVQNENDLKLFIKIPANNTSTIVVLEGNYENWNDKIVSMMTVKDKNGNILEYKELKSKTNRAVLNFEYIDDAINNYKNVFCSQLQLLSMNVNEQIPFSDSLIEYLIGNAITGEEEISDNILRAQKVIAAEVNKDKKEDEYHYTIDNEGIWDDKIKAIVYEYMTKKFSASGGLYDITGYINKDAEKHYNYSYRKKVGKDRFDNDIWENRAISISQVDLDDKEIMEDL